MIDSSLYPSYRELNQHNPVFARKKVIRSVYQYDEEASYSKDISDKSVCGEGDTEKVSGRGRGGIRELITATTAFSSSHSLFH